MRASVGDKLHIHTSHVGVQDQWGRIVEVRGADGTPPFVVEFPDGHTHLLYPGPDAVVEPAPQPRLTQAAESARPRRVHTRVGW